MSQSLFALIFVSVKTMPKYWMITVNERKKKRPEAIRDGIKSLEEK